MALVDFLEVHYPVSTYDSCIHLGCRGRNSSAIKTVLACDLSEFLDSFLGLTFYGTSDYYISSNGFSGSHRRVSTLFAIHNLVIDIDCHGDFISSERDELLEDFLWRLNHDVFNDILCEPTTIVKTGRGLQLWWAIEPVPSVYKQAFDEVIDAYIQTLLDFLDSSNSWESFDCLSIDQGASRNIAGYFRLPCTTNTLASVRTSFETTRKRYKILDLLTSIKSIDEEPIPETVKSKTKIRSSQSHQNCLIEPFINSYNPSVGLGREREDYCISLRSLRNRPEFNEERNNLCFIYYNSSLSYSNHETAYKKLIEFNNGFIHPMTEFELDNVISSARKKGGYFYSNTSFCNFLGITDEEARRIGFTVSSNNSSKYVKKVDKVARNKEVLRLYDDGLTLEKISKDIKVSIPTLRKILSENNRSHKNDRDSQIKELSRAGKTNNEIAQLCGCSKRTVQRALA